MQRRLVRGAREGRGGSSDEARMVGDLLLCVPEVLEAVLVLKLDLLAPGFEERRSVLIWPPLDRARASVVREALHLPYKARQLRLVHEGGGRRVHDGHDGHDGLKIPRPPPPPPRVVAVCKLHGSARLQLTR